MMEFEVRRGEQTGAARKNEVWGSLTWLAGSNVSTGDTLTLGRVVIRRGQSNPRHAHSNCCEALYLLSGRLRHTVGTEEVILEPGDTLIVPPGVFHNAETIGEEDADMIVAYDSAQRDFIPEG